MHCSLLLPSSSLPSFLPSSCSLFVFHPHYPLPSQSIPPIFLGVFYPSPLPSPYSPFPLSLPHQPPPLLPIGLAFLGTPSTSRCIHMQIASSHDGADPSPPLPFHLPPPACCPSSLGPRTGERRAREGVPVLMTPRSYSST